jgi:hypothetical protein
MSQCSTILLFSSRKIFDDGVMTPPPGLAPAVDVKDDEVSVGDYASNLVVRFREIGVGPIEILL